jgi:outer membrane protein
MKIKSIFSVLALIVVCTASFGQTNWVSRFLGAYPQPQALQGRVPVTIGPVSLSGMVRNGALSLTTEDIVRLLLENNRDLTVSRIVPVSSLYSIWSLYRPFQPNFHVIGALTRTTSPSSNVLAGAVSLVQMTHDYRVGFDQTLLTGTSYSVDFDFTRSSSNSVFTVYNPAYNGKISYAITQHVLRDFGERVNSHQIRIARNNEKVSELDFELQIIDLVAQALQSYWDLVFAAEDIKVKQRSLDLASKTLKDNQIQVQVGTLAPIDLVQAEAEVASRYDELISAQYNNDQLQDQMKKLISSDTDPGLVAARLDLVQPLRQPDAEAILPLSSAIQSALENRRELKQAEYDADNQEINIQYTKNQMLPVLDITAGYAHSGLGGTKTIRSSLGTGAQVIEVIPGGIGDMFTQLFGFNYPGYNAGFTLQIPLRNTPARADYDRALNEREVSARRKAATAQRIVIEVRNAYTQLEMNRSRITTARTARELAARRLDAEQKKFELGTSTVRFVLEEQRNVAQAETNDIQALVNYAKALVAYDRAIGNILTQNNIQLDRQLPRQLTFKN